MEDKAIDKMVRVSKSVKGEMDNYLTRLETKTSANLCTWNNIRMASNSEHELSESGGNQRIRRR